MSEVELKTSRFSGKAALRTASANGEKTGHATFLFSKKEWSTLTAATFSNFEDLRQGGWRTGEFPDFGKRFFYQKRFGDRDSSVANDKPNIQVGSGYRQANLLQKFSFQKSAAVRHDLNFYFTTTGDVPRYGRLSETKNGCRDLPNAFMAPKPGFWAVISFIFGLKTEAGLLKKRI